MATAFMKRVLTVIRDNPKADATRFAEELFKGNPKLSYQKRTGHGVTIGTRLNLVASTARARAVREGLAVRTYDVTSRDWKFTLTLAGRREING